MLERLSSSSVALRPEQAMCIQYVSEENDVFMAVHGFCCATRFYHSNSTTSFNRDNSVVLVVSPLLSLMINKVDGVQAETGGLRRRARIALLTDDVASNLAHAI